LIVPGFLPRILSIADREHLRPGNVVVPDDTENLLLAHCRRDRELDDCVHRDGLTGVALEVRDKTLDFIIGGSSISLDAFPYETEPLKCDASQVDRLNRDR